MYAVKPLDEPRRDDHGYPAPRSPPHAQADQCLSPRTSAHDAPSSCLLDRTCLGSYGQEPPRGSQQSSSLSPSNIHAYSNPQAAASSSHYRQDSQHNSTTVCVSPNLQSAGLLESQKSGCIFNGYSDSINHTHHNNGRPFQPPPPPAATYDQSPYAQSPYVGQYAGAAFQQVRRKQVRATQACNHCRTRKQKCDEARPCQFCRENNFDCQYKDVPPPKCVANHQANSIH